MLNHQYSMSKIGLLFHVRNSDVVLKKSISISGSIFNTKSACFQRSVPAGYDGHFVFKTRLNYYHTSFPSHVSFVQI